MVSKQGCTVSTVTVDHPLPSHPFHGDKKLQKRQAPLPPFTGQAQQDLVMLATAIYIVEVINNGGNLSQVCLAFNVTAAYLEGLDGNLAKQKICAAALHPPPPANSSSINGIIALSTALFAVEVAGNYTGGTNLTTLCNLIDVNTITLLGFDGAGVKNFVCAAASGTSLPPTPMATTLATVTTTCYNSSTTRAANPVTTTTTTTSFSEREHHSRATFRPSDLGIN